MTDELYEKTKNNLIIFDMFVKAESVLSKYNNIACSISGGADSDILIDICEKVKPKSVRYVFFDTGIEYKATLDHLTYLENKYGVKIERIRSKLTVPKAIKEAGQPFLSKNSNTMIARLQSRNFDFANSANKSLEELEQEYPKTRAALRWWTNDFDYTRKKDGKQVHSKFSVGYNKYFREFMIDNPPSFKISNMCCKYVKKDTAAKFIKDNDIDLMIVGTRKAEGGARSSAYKSCFDESNHGAAQYRPIFWFKNDDRKEYEEIFNVIHSKCYTEYGLKRTGCAGCPYGRDYQYELEVLEKYEPKLAVAIKNIFADSYAYTKKYEEYKENRDRKTE